MKLGKRLCAWLLCFVLLLGLVPGVVMEASAEETEAWSGSEAISWNADIPGTQFKTPDGTFSGLAKGDVIKIYTHLTAGNYGDPQYVVTYEAGDSWSWTDLTVSVSDGGTITYTVESDDIATTIAQRKLIFRGQAYTITKITVTKSAAEPAASTVSKLWSFNGSKENWGVTWSNDQNSWVDDTNYTDENGAIKFSLPKPGEGTWSQTASALNSSDACDVPGLGPVTVDVICRTDDKDLLNDMKIKVKFNNSSISRECVDWTNFSNVGSNSWTQIETTDFYYRTVTVPLDILTKWSYDSNGSNDVTVDEKTSFNANTNWYNGGLQISFASNSYSSSSEKGSVYLWLDNITIGTVNNRPATPDAPVAAEASETVDTGNTQGWTQSGSWGQSNVSLGTMSQSNRLQVKFQLENSENQWKTLQLVHTAAAAPAENTTISMKVYYAANEMPVANNSLLIKAFYRYNDGSKDVTTTETENCKHTLSTSTDANGTELKLEVSGCPTNKEGGYFILQFTSANGTSGICTLYIDNIKIAATTDSGQGGQGSGEGDDPNPANTYAVNFATEPSDVPISVFTSKTDDKPISSSVSVNKNTSLSFTVAGTYHNTGTGDYYKLQKVENSSSILTASNGVYTVSADASIMATYAKLNWKLTYDGDNGVTSASLVEDAYGIPTVTFSALEWKSVYLSNNITANSGDNGLSVTISNNGSAADFELTAELGNDKVTKSVNLPNGEAEILFPFEKTLSGGTFKLTIKAGSGGVTNASLTVKEVKTAKLHTLTISNPEKKWLKTISVNGIVVNTDNTDAKETVGVVAGLSATIKVKNIVDGDAMDYVKRVTVDGKVVNIGTAQDNVYTYTLENVSADHTIVVTYEYSGTPITPEEPAVETTEVATTSTDTTTSTATVSESVATTVTSALNSNKAAGITATDADNVALDAAVVTALATSESNKGNNGVVAVIETKNVTVEAPAAMFSSAKNGSGASVPVTLKTERKETNTPAGGNTIAAAAAASGETGTVKGAVDVSLVNTSSTEEIKVDLGESVAKPITIKTEIEEGLYKNQLRVGYIKGDKLVFDDTVRLTAYDKASGKMAFTTTHFTTFVVVSDNEFVWNFENGLDGWGFGWKNDYEAPTDKKVSHAGGALKLSLDYTNTPKRKNPWPSFTVKYSGEAIPLSGKNYLSMDVYYDAGALGGSTLLFTVGASKDSSNLITADTAQLNTYAAADATIDGRTMKKTTVLIGFKRDVSSDNNELNIDVINTSGTYKGDVYLDNITIGTASHFITTSINEDYRGAFIPGGRVPMLGESTTIYVVQKGSDQRIAKLTLDGETVSGASHKTTYQFTYKNDAVNHRLYAEFEWFDANGSAGLMVSSGEVFRAELTNPVAAVGEKLVQPEAEVKNGTLTAAINEKEISDIIAEVETAEKTDVITIIPYVKDRKTEVTRTEVALPAASVSELAEKTGAALRVETVVAAITIPNEALKEIGSEGGIIAVAAERAEEYMELSVTANGSRLTDIRGGISASVPMECGPGTVAMLAEDELRTRSELVNRSAGHGSEADPVEKDNPTESVEGKPLLYSAANSQGTAMTVLLPGSARIRFVHQAKRFTDVPEVSWASGAVDFVSSHRIFGGYDDGAFYPNSVMNRAMLVQVLYNMSERPAVEHGSVFADVPSGAWFADAVNWASGTRVVRGYGDGTFAPGATITRQDAVVILYRYAGEPECEDTDLSRFEDEDRIGTYARKAIQWAVSRRLLNGVSASQLAPGAELTRYQAAKLLMNYVQDRVG